ncbi:hypothetical protein FQN50_002889 [Emmonsiellopsis sp. PD_5]|nr:hypothetical protein FQN50_002889 [Emmonsiellopsis sp. PD_5]
MSTPNSETDVIFNRANVALARSQRLIASWLPPKTAEEIANAKTDEELQREEDEIFTAVPEKLGLGAPLPKSQADGSANRTELSSNEKLRKQLMGKNYKKFAANAQNTGRPVAEKKHQPPPASRVEPESDDEEEGRSSLGKNKRKRPMREDKNTAVEGEDDAENAEFTSNSRTSQRKKPVSYLDELLSQRLKKKKRT